MPRSIPQRKAELFKALGHPVRISALELLSTSDRTVSELTTRTGVEQPYLSQQLAVLRRADLVTARREGPNVVYSLADDRVAAVLALAKELLLDIVTATRDELRAS